MNFVRERFFWPKMAKDVEDYVKSCERCIKRKSPSQVAPMTPIQATHPLQFVTMDYLTVEKAMGYENILVIIDHFTKFAQAYPTKNQKATTTAKFVLDFIRRYGFPEKFHSDQGQTFVGKVMKNLCKLAGISRSNTTPYHPMGNGLSEHFNRTLLSMIGTLTKEKKKAWPKYLADLVLAYNSSTHESTGYSPYFMMFGRQPRLPIDVAMGITLDDDEDDFVKSQQEIFRTAYNIASRKIREAGSKQKKYYDKGRSKKASDILTPGTQVLVKQTGFQERHKIADVWEDDVYIIIDQPHRDIPVYTVENQTSEGTKTVHRNLLLPLPMILDWMRPMEPDIIVKPVGDDPGVEDHTKSEHDTSSDEEDSELSGDEAFYTHTQTQHKIKKSKPEIQGEMRAENINEPSEQEIDRQSDSDSNSCQSADNGSDGEEGRGAIHSTPLAQRKSAREIKLPKKYDGFILGPMKQLNAILENHLLGRVFNANKNTQICI